ncbi:MAG: cadmium resistance transporter [Oscillospiraceae bacterium]|nr:cadmium resistance transporter [Oscillospiraceae bacterium]
MVNTAVSSVFAYVATNIDDLFILMLLYTAARGAKQNTQIVSGRYAGIFLLVAAGCLGAYGLQTFAGRYLPLMGLIPIALGIKELFSAEEDDTQIEYRRNMTVTTALMTIASGRDNIGVYTALFARWKLPQLSVMAVVFAVMTAVWCIIGRKLAYMPLLQKMLTQHRKKIVPLVYISLGIYIMIK